MATKPFLNFEVDHMTMLSRPEMYNFTYVVMRTIFGVGNEDVIYNVRKRWEGAPEDESLTFAVKLGDGANIKKETAATMMALVQPSEPESMPSHVRRSLKQHDAAVLWQHIALRTPDLVAFHEHALERGVRFVTPILKDGHEDLIQVFTGEWFYPGMTPSGVFFEFVQREPTADTLKMIEERNRETFFRDKAFMGLYGEKEDESRGGEIVPFLDPAVYRMIMEVVGNKKHWDITQDDFDKCEEIMIDYAKKNPEPVLN